MGYILKIDLTHENIRILIPVITGIGGPIVTMRQVWMSPETGRTRARYFGKL